MIFGTIFGVIVIPGLYVVFASMADKRHRGGGKEDAAFTETI
jgi:HAE1 family hydrophobic/amphiphilic exporter-1